MKNTALIFGSLLLLASCTQEQAPVVDQGREFYGHGTSHGATGSYSEDEGSMAGSTGSYAPSAQPENTASIDYPSNYRRGGGQTTQAAPAPAVGMSDLPPASGAAASGNNAPSSSSGPFSSAPSKPLSPEEKGEVVSGGEINTTGTPDSFTPLSPHDGISLIWPVNGGKVIAHFKGIMNDGINIAIAEGEPIMAAASGTVVYSGNDLRDYGNMVIVRHDNGWMTAYANASRIVAKKGAYVKQGDIIAYVGTSGNVKTPQLHFALRKGKTPVDPEKYLPKLQ